MTKVFRPVLKHKWSGTDLRILRPYTRIKSTWCALIDGQKSCGMKTEKFTLLFLQSLHFNQKMSTDH